MTIKAQGQTLRMAGLYVPTQPLSHGRLYVAKTRVVSSEWLSSVAWLEIEKKCMIVVHKKLLLRCCM